MQFEKVENMNQDSARTGLQPLETWQKEINKRFVAGESLLVLLPGGGGRSHCYIPQLKNLSGTTVILLGSEQRKKRREAQLQALSQTYTCWSSDQPWPSDATTLLTLEEDWNEFSEEKSPWGEKSAPEHIIVDSPHPTTTPPAWWKWVEQTHHLVLPSQPSTRTGWWMNEDNTTQSTLLIPPAEELPLQLQEEQQTAIDYLRAHAADKKTYLWFGDQAPETIEGIDLIHVNKADSLPTEAPTETSRVFFLEEGETPTFPLPPIDVALHEGLPSNLRSIGMSARLANGNIVFIAPEGQTGAHKQRSPPSKLATALHSWLLNRKQTQPTPQIATSASQMLQDIGYPITPQPTFERHLQELEEALQWMLESDLIQDVQEVHTHVKLHRASKLKEVQLSPHPELLKFWKVYDVALQQMSPLDSLKYTFLTGRTLDLTLLAQKLPYSIYELNDIFRTFDQKGLMVTELQHGSLPYKTDKEFQLSLEKMRPVSRSVQLWMQCKEKRGPLLWAALSQAPFELEPDLTQLWELSPKQSEVWKRAWSIVKTSKEADRLLHLAARTLAYLEDTSSPTASLLWELTSTQIKLHGLETHELLDILPPTSQADSQMSQPLRAVYQHHDGEIQAALKDYILDVKADLGFKEVSTSFVEEHAEEVLSMQSIEQNTTLMRRYAKQANVLSETQLSSACSLAAAWASHLLGHKEKSLQWLKDMNAQTPLEQWRMAQIAVANTKPELALDTLLAKEITLPAEAEQIKALRSSLLAQCFDICKKQSRCKGCSLRNSAYCPQDVDTFMQQVREREEEEEQHRLLRLSKRLRADFNQQPTEWLQSLLEEDAPGTKSQKVERVVLRCLADRKEANVDQLLRIADWCDRDGAWQHALSYRKQIAEQTPEHAQNLARLATLTIRKENDVPQGLRWALQATHADPRNFPLEPFLDEHGEHLLADLDALRELLIELPAHPALSAFEQELTQREETKRKLIPVLQNIEELMTSRTWAKALTQAKEVLEKEPRFAPVRFREIVDEIEEYKAGVLKDIERLPRRDRKKRNRILENHAEEALELGFPALATQVYRKLMKFNPQYGLGHLKLARISDDKKEQQQSYEKAVELARSPEQRRKNLQEYADRLAKGDELDKILPLLLKLIKAYPAELSKVVRPTLTRLIDRHGTKDKIVKPIEKALDQVEDKKAVKPIKDAIMKISDIDPWKRTLLSIKLKK